MLSCCTVALADDTSHPVALDAHRVFHLIDSDGNGKISLKEFGASTTLASWRDKIEQAASSAAPSVPALPPEPSERDFVFFILKLDRLDAVVLLDLIERELVMEPIERLGKELFEMLDTDCDGKIDLGDEASALADFTGQLVLSEMDFDRSGAVDKKEFTSALRAKTLQSPVRVRVVLTRAKAHLLAKQREKDIQALQAFQLKRVGFAPTAAPHASPAPAPLSSAPKPTRAPAPTPAAAPRSAPPGAARSLPEQKANTSSATVRAAKPMTRLVIPPAAPSIGTAPSQAAHRMRSYDVPPDQHLHEA